MTASNFPPSWITGNHYRDTNQPIIVPLENFPLLKVQPYNDPKGYLSASSKLEPASESKLFPSYLAPNYDGSFWTLLLQSPLRTLAQLTSWNNPFAGNSWGFMPALTPTTSPLLANQPPASTAVGFESAHSTPVHSGSHTSPNGQASQMNNQMNNQQTANYKAAASTNTVKHASAQEEAPVYLSAFVANFRLDAYHNLDDIYEYLDRLAAIHKHIRVFTIGYSHENRPIKAIEIHQDTANLNKKMVYLDGLIHAREHITTAALLNIIEQILIRKIDCNFLIVPVINVDGKCLEIAFSHKRSSRSDFFIRTLTSQAECIFVSQAMYTPGPPIDCGERTEGRPPRTTRSCTAYVRDSPANAATVST